MPSYPPSLDALGEMLDYIEAEAKAAGILGKELSRLKLASEEMLVNVISYGFPSRTKESHISLTCKQTQGRFLIEIADNGILFNPLATPKHVDTKASLEKRTYGGYGIFLVRQILDDVQYHRENNQNVVTLIKIINDP
jgi:serine/threonine-protein kinase RsbW